MARSTRLPMIPAGSFAHYRGRRATYDHRDWVVHWLGTPLHREGEVALIVPADRPTDMRRKRWVDSWRVDLTDDAPIALPAYTPPPPDEGE